MDERSVYRTWSWYTWDMIISQYKILYMLWLHEQAGSSHSPGGPHSVASGPAHLPLWALLGVACIMKGHKRTGRERGMSKGGNYIKRMEGKEREGKENEETDRRHHWWLQEIGSARQGQGAIVTPVSSGAIYNHKYPLALTPSTTHHPSTSGGATSTNKGHKCCLPVMGASGSKPLEKRP